jgi:phage terminase large subunit
MEEGDQYTERDFNQMDLRLRGETDFTKQGIITLNPIWAGHWIKKRFFDRKEPDCLTHRSTYRDNRFLDRATVRRLEQITDPYFKMVYVDGDWGIYGNVVFSNFIIEDFDAKESDLSNVTTGMDFGFVHASAIIRSGFKDGELYCFDELYGKSWTNSQFIEAAEDYFGDDGHYWPITADSAEPDRISEWEAKNWRVTPAVKGRGSLQYGIDFLTRQKIHVHATKCPNLAREIQSFKRREDRSGEATERFVEIDDDCIAALRYGTEQLWDDGSNGMIADYELGDLGL